MSPLYILHPQWQGSGLVKGLEQGARVLSAFLDRPGTREIPLSSLPFDEVQDKQDYKIIAFRQIREQLSVFHNQLLPFSPERVYTIGGDCGIEVIPISYLNQLYAGDMTVLWFDGHADLNSPASSPSKHFHGMPVRLLLGEAVPGISETQFSTLRPDQVIYVGTNDLDPPESAFILEHGIDVIDSPDYQQIRQCLLNKGKKNVYVHFDLDVLSGKEFPHTPYPNKTGFSIDPTLGVIRQLYQEFQIAGSAVTESIAMTPAQLQPVAALLDALIPPGPAAMNNDRQPDRQLSRRDEERGSDVNADGAPM